MEGGNEVDVSKACFTKTCHSVALLTNIYWRKNKMNNHIDNDKKVIFLDNTKLKVSFWLLQSPFWLLCHGMNSLTKKNTKNLPR